MKKTLFLSMLSGVCAALSAQTFSGGSGTQNDPWLISKVADLQELTELVDSPVDDYSSNTYGKYFLLTQDITEPFRNVIGNIYAFNGHFDGGGHTIHVDINQRVSYVGLFTTASQGSIRNLQVEGSVVGLSSVAAIVANPTNGLVMENLVSYADVIGTSQSVMSSVGGVIGNMVSQKSGKACTVKHCANYGAVTCYGGAVGGVIGYSGQQLGNTITAIANYGRVEGQAGDNYRVGGVIGNPLWDDIVHQVANFGTIGDATISGCMGNSNPEDQGELFYDSQTVTTAVAFPSQAKLTTEMLGRGLAGDLSEDDWVFEDDLYPRLRMGGIENAPRVLLYATPIILDPADQIDHIAHSFRAVTKNGVTWSSQNGRVSFDSQGNATLLSQGEDVLTATLNGYSRLLPVTITATTDAIVSVTSDRPTVYDRPYNLMGQPVGNDYKGIVIINGKKIKR